MASTTERTVRRAVGGGASALALVAASLAVAPPASAATCGNGSGVSVVVDRASLGGGVSTGCDADGGGKPASAVFPGGGAPLTYAAREPGFVCRVLALPQSDPCTQTSPANAYWSLWWSNGTSGTWTYSSFGVAGLKVPAGGSVAFRFSTGEKTPPAYAAPVHEAGSSSGGSGGGSGGGPGGGSGGGPGGGSGDTGGSGPKGSPANPTPSSGAPSTPVDPTPSTGSSPDGEPSASPSTRGGASARRDRPAADAGDTAKRSGTRKAGADPKRGDRPSATPSDATTDATTDAAGDGVGDLSATSAAAAESSEAAAAEPDGLPGWVAPGVLGLLVVAGAATALVRRRRLG